MRKLAFGYSNRCNIRCEHCVATEETPDNKKMDLEKALEIIVELAKSGVSGISFSAGEPFIYFNDTLKLVKLCSQKNIYTRIVTNSFWAKSKESADEHIVQLKKSGLCQLRLSYSRWHQKNVNKLNVLNAARSCEENGLEYYISFISDFSKEDDQHEQFLRTNKLKFFPEPIIYSGRADSLERRNIQTDYQVNCCNMNPYLAPNLDMYACCDAGTHFPDTNFFYLGNLSKNSSEHLFNKSETDPLYKLIRSMGITNIASYAGMKSREIITYSKCELCKILFNNPEMVARLRAELPRLAGWNR